MNDKEIKKKVYSLIFPIILENILEMAAGLVSTAMIGRINVTSIATQGVCFRIIGILWCIFKGIAIGATVLVARYWGAEEIKKVKKVSIQTLLSAILVGLISEIIMLLGSKFLLGFFNPDKNVLNLGISYLKIISIGVPFQAVMVAGVGILQGMGDGKTPMFISLVMNIVNIIVGYSLIFGHFGFKPMGLKGAAIATIISEVVATIFGIYVLFNKNGILHNMNNKEMFKLDFKEISLIFKIGVPSALESLFWQFSAIILTKVMLTFGEVAFSAYQMGLQAETISEMPALGFEVAATTFVGQALGAKDSKLGERYIKVIKQGGIIIMALGSAILLCFPKPLMRILTSDVRVVNLGAIYIWLMGLIQIPQNFARVYNGALKGAGFTNIPMIVAGIGLWGVRIPLSLILTYVFHTDIVIIWCIICVDQAFRFIISVIWYRKKDIFADKATSHVTFDE